MSLYPLKLYPVLSAAALAMMLFAGCVALQYLGVNVLGLYPAGLSIMTNYEFQGTIGNIDIVSGYLSLVSPLLLGGYIAESGKGRGKFLMTGGLSGVLLLGMMGVESGLLALMCGMMLLVVLMLRRPEYRARGCAALGGCLFCFAVRHILHLPWIDGGDALMLTAPDTAAIILFAAAAVLLMLKRVFARHQGKRIRVRTVLMISVTVVVIVPVLLYCIPVEEEDGTLWEISETMHGRAQDHFGKERIGVWRMTLDMAQKNLLFGTGQDTFFYAFADYITTNGEIVRQTFDYPHNEYLAILSNAGLPALLAYLLMLGVVICCCLRRSRGQPMLLALSGAMICYAVQAHFSFSICLQTPMFWSVLGMAASELTHEMMDDKNASVQLTDCKQ